MASRSKYGAVPVEIDGHRFASQNEGKRYMDLRMLERVGVISGLELQPRFPIIVDGAPIKYPSGRILTYVADFAYFRGQERVIEDAKGMQTDVFKIKRALVEAIYKVKVETV
jgi:hypothetical protein